MGLFDLPWKLIVALFEGASGVVRWLTGNTVRMVFVLGIVVVLPLSITIVGFILSGSESSRGAAWREYFQAREEVTSRREDADWLVDLVLLGPQGEFTGNSLRNSTVPKLWALQFAADMELRDGARLVYSSQTEAQDRLTHAIELYDRIAGSSSGVDGLLHERVLLGKAHAHEVFLACSSDVNDFKRHYTAAMTCLDDLLASATNSSLKVTAQRRKAVLLKFGKEVWTEGKLSSGSFYSWLSNYEAPEIPLEPFPGNLAPPGLPAPSIPFPDPGELLPPPLITPPLGDAVDLEGEDGNSGDAEPGESDNSEESTPGDGDNSGDGDPVEDDESPEEE